MLYFLNMKTYTVSKVKQLIDLNGDSINFDITFKVTSRKGEPFQILVVDQSTLDNNTELKYKTITNGSISGKIQQNKNIYQNHFLILRSENPCECDVEIHKTDLITTNNPINPTPNPNPNPMNVNTNPINANTNPMSPMNPVATTNTISTKSSSVNSSSFEWIQIILIAGLVLGVGISIYWFSQKNKNIKLYTPPATTNPRPSNFQNNLLTPPNPILEKLKKMNMD